MKKFTLLVAVLCTALLQAQENFPYKRPELLINKEVTVKPMHPRSEEIFGGYENFYSDKGAYSSSIYKKNEKGVTSSASLTNRTFKVISSELDSSTPFPYYIFKLEDNETKELVYYKYNLELARTQIYPFTVIGGLDLPADFYCDYVQKVGTTDPSYYIESMSTYRLEKDMVKGKAKYTLSLMTTDTPSAKEGVVINLENNISITRPKYPMGIGNAFASIELTAKEIELLKNNKIIDFTIGKAEGLMGDREAMAIKEGFECLMSK